jgi:peptide/nickel transport system permease protein
VLPDLCGGLYPAEPDGGDPVDHFQPTSEASEMSGIIWFIVVLVALFGAAFAFRFAGQKFTNNAPKFRDMPFGVAFGYVLAAALLIWAVYYYFQPKVLDTGVPNAGVVFFRWAVQGFIIAAIAAFLFRLLGRAVGTEGTKKLFRAMPLTASFGILVIIIYAVVAVFAGAIAPYGQAEILGAANVMAGGDPALGGNPEYPLGTDQIGRDILSRLIYGAQNTVGIAFITTLLAFFIGGSLGFLAATAMRVVASPFRLIKNTSRPDASTTA